MPNSLVEAIGPVEPPAVVVVLAFLLYPKGALMVIQDLDQHLRPSEAARQLDCSPQSVVIWLDRGLLDGVKTRAGRLITRESVARLAAQRAAQRQEAAHVGTGE